MGSWIFHLPDVLKRHGITQRGLASEAGLRHATVNALCQGKLGRVHLESVGAVLDALERLTGTRYAVGDLFEWRQGEP